MTFITSFKKANVTWEGAGWKNTGQSPLEKPQNAASEWLPLYSSSSTTFLKGDYKTRLPLNTSNAVHTPKCDYLS